MHTDDEPIFWNKPQEEYSIASVSFGYPKDFVVHHIESGVEVRVPTKPLDILLMTKKFQWQWLHAVPQMKKSLGPRLNLTFRNIVNHNESCKCFKQ